MKIILGTMNFGPQVNTEDSNLMVQEFLKEGYHELDSAYVYNNGDTEKMLGTYLGDLMPDAYSIATKIHPRITGSLDAEAVELQFNQSLERMNRKSVDILYFHFPDDNTPLDSALKKCAQLHQEGKFKEFGLSNFPAWMVVEVWHLCEKYGCPKPTVYQGMYNALSRNVEKELFRVLRRLGMRFYAFNPLAGGLLTGKYTSVDDLPNEGRFARLKSYRERYWKASNFDAIKPFIRACEKESIKPVDAAFRWLVNHSFLARESGDGVIVGASSIAQLKQNVNAIQEGELPESIIEALDSAWAKVADESPEYYRFFTSL